MPWPFCNNCGCILNPPDIDEVSCSTCPFKAKFQDFHIEPVVTRSSPRPIASWAKDSTDIENEPSEKHAVIQEPCPKCGHHELYFYTMQLRSVDEGSTVFYECPKCSHKYSLNN